MALAELPEAFIFMKVGNHAGETFDEILERKNREFRDAGRMFWGYGGTACHPLRQVQPFARLSLKKHGSIYLLMQNIDSRADPDVLSAKEFSEDGVHWRPIPQGIEVIGSRYALVLDEIRPGDLEFRAGDYEVGIGPSRGKRAADYLRGHVDKGCLRLASKSAPGSGEVKRIGHTASLIEPYAVLLR